MHLTHPFRITPGEIVVNGDHVHTATCECIEVTGEGGDQGFALAGFHLSDLSFMEHHSADQLNIEMAHTEHALAGLAHDRKGFGQDLVENGALVLEAAGIGQPLLKGCGSLAKALSERDISSSSRLMSETIGW